MRELVRRLARSCSAPGLVLAQLALLGACGDNLSVPDAREIDAAPPPDVAPDGPCGSGLYVTGELVDIDSTTAVFNGGLGTLTLRGAAGVSDATSPNGRFELCAPALTTYVFDLDVTGAGAAQPRVDGVDGIVYIEPEALGAGNEVISFRTFTPARIATFFTENDLVYDPTKAQVFVDITGDRSNLTLDRAHDAELGGNDDGSPGTFTWAPGQGRYTLFPNVDVTQATGTIGGDVSGGTHTVPLAAGTITYVALSWRFL